MSQIFILIATVAVSSTSFGQTKKVAASGGESGGGGDLQCESLIRDLTTDNIHHYDLKDWLLNGGPENGKLDLSSSLNPDTQNPYTYAEYKSQMLKFLDLPLYIKCVKPGDVGYPVEVDGAPKICKSTVDSKGSIHEVCDRALYMALDIDLKIEQGHHEIAIHVPGLEPDTASISTSKISSQLSWSIDNVTERRLLVKPVSSASLECKPNTQYQVGGGQEKWDCSLLDSIFNSKAKTPSGKVGGRAFMTNYAQKISDYSGDPMEKPLAIVLTFGELSIWKDFGCKTDKNCMAKEVESLALRWDNYNSCPRSEYDTVINPYTRAWSTKAYDKNTRNTSRPCAPHIEVKQYGNYLIGFQEDFVSVEGIGMASKGKYWFVADIKKGDLGLYSPPH